MRRLLICPGLLAALVLGCVHSPVAWSPDGRWLAYTTATRRADRVLAPGWIFGGAPAKFVPSAAVASDGGDVSYQLWATRPDSGASVLLERSPGPLTSPGWNPDGTALAFGRLVPEAEGGARFEVVVQEAPGRQRVLRREALTEFKPEAAGLPALAVAWSPDGRLLAAPQVQPRGLVILRLDDGRAIKTIDEAYLPSWSPTGGRLAFYRGGAPEGLFGLDARLGEPRLLAEIAQPVVAPAWSPDGRTVWAIRRRADGPVELLKVGAEGEGIEVYKTLVEGVPPDQSVGPSSFAVERSGQEFFYSTHAEGQPAVVVQQRLRDNAILRRFNPVDPLVPLGGLAASPAGRWLALRAGPPGIVAPVALCEIESQKLTPLAPDDAARAEWLATLIDAARAILRQAYPPPTVAGQALERPTLLPSPGEPPTASEAQSRLRHLANLGRPLCDRPAASGEADPGLTALQAEARLFFDYLREDYDGALEALDAFEPDCVGVDRRLGLLALRAQVQLGRGDAARARAAISYLKGALPEGPGRVEMTPDGPVLTADPGPRAGWISYLSDRAEERFGGRPPEVPPASGPADTVLVPGRAAPAAAVPPPPRPVAPRRRRGAPPRFVPQPPPAPPALPRVQEALIDPS